MTGAAPDESMQMQDMHGMRSDDEDSRISVDDEQAALNSAGNGLDDGDASSSSPPLDGKMASAVHALYAAHFLATFGDRMWQFAIPYLFTKLWDRDMTPQSIFCLLLYAASFFGTVQVGRWIDTSQRLPAMRLSIVLEALSILLSAVFFCVLLEAVFSASQAEDGTFVKDPNDVTLFENGAVFGSYACLLATAVFAELMTKAGTIMVERDWVVEIADRNSTLQTTLNTWLRRIDLTCKLGGPFVFVLVDTVLQAALGSDSTPASGTVPGGANPTFYSAKRAEFLYGIGVVVVWTILAAPLELRLIHTVYEAFPKLQRLKDTARLDQEAPSRNPLSVFASGVTQWWRHPVRWMSLSYAQLWCTVVDNGTLMTAFLLSQNVNSFALVSGRGLGAMFGILGTFLFPHVVSRCGTIRASGAVSLYSFFVFIAVVGVCFLLLPAIGAGYVMLVLVVFSRAPLWCFDLAVQQLMQEDIAESQRGVINGVHSSLCQLMLVCVRHHHPLVANPTTTHSPPTPTPTRLPPTDVRVRRRLAGIAVVQRVPLPRLSVHRFRRCGCRHVHTLASRRACERRSPERGRG